MTPDGVILDNLNLLLIYEWKKMGASSGDPLAQAINVFSKYNSNKYPYTPFESRPCFILTQDNTSFDLFGICRTVCENQNPVIYARHLANLRYADPYPNLNAALCQFFQSLINGLKVLKSTFKEHSINLIPVGLNGNVYRRLYHSEKYVSKILKTAQETRVVEIVPKYGQEVHQYLAGLGYAPKLFGIDSATYHGFLVVEMEYLGDGKVNLLSFFREFPVPSSSDPTHQAVTQKYQTVFTNLAQVVQTLHASDYVHGDLREENILVDVKTLQVFLIDFDWSGKSKFARYPFQLNKLTILWASDVEENGLIDKNHDLHFVQLLQNRHSTQVVQAER